MRSPAERLRRRSPSAVALDCAAVAREIENQLDSRGEPRPELVAHIEHCLRCQAELARHKKLLRLLAQLRDEVVPLPEGLVGGVLAAVGEAAERQAMRAALGRHRFAYASGVGAGVAVLVVVGFARRRTLRERHA
ncbi:MAG: hypothetical protein WB770_11820 [Acidimicrobiales bacterium]